MRAGWIVLALTLSLSFTVAGCKDGGGAAAPAAEGAKSGEAAPAKAEVDEKTAALLAKADAKDGTTDKVVTQCAACMLKMAGSADHSCKVGEYTLHNCSAGCAESVKADPAKVLAKALGE